MHVSRNTFEPRTAYESDRFDALMALAGMSNQ
jgi:hypothetical protein